MKQIHGKRIVSAVAVIFFLAFVAPMILAGGKKEAEPSRVVEVFGAFVDEEARRFEEAIQPFIDRTGIEIQYQGSPDFETLIFVRAEGGNPPNITALPQPGLMKNLAGGGHLTPLWPEALAEIDRNYAPVWKDLGSFEGTPYGIFHRVNAKSLVWYPRKAWEAQGYEPPETWDEMFALMDEMVANGHTPWAAGMESGGATGWYGTDWIEDIVLRTAGPDVYDQWVENEVPFTDPRIREAFEILGEIWLNPDYVYGGTQSLLTTSIPDAPLPMFQDPPRAWMHRQGNFVTGFFPDRIQDNLDEEVGVFALPSINPEWGTPMMGGGDQFVMFNQGDTPEARSFMEFLATWESGEAWARSGGALFPYVNQDLSAYSSELERLTAQALVEAEVFRFDASDLMPAAVGAGTFWAGMVDFVGGQDLDTVLRQIESGWEQ